MLVVGSHPAGPEAEFDPAPRQHVDGGDLLGQHDREAPFSARHEQAQTVGDVLLRRTRLGLLAARSLCAADSDAPRRVAEAMGGELGWDDARVAAEVRRFGEEARAEGIVLTSLTSVS